MLLVLIALFLGAFVFPTGLPVGVEIAFLLALWTNVACQAITIGFDR